MHVPGILLWVALAYPFGNLQQMGPGFFPRALGVILMGFGAVTMIRGLRSGIRVFWGSAEQSELKSQVTDLLLEGDGKVFDVSAPTHPTRR